MTHTVIEMIEEMIHTVREHIIRMKELITPRAPQQHERVSQSNYYYNNRPQKYHDGSDGLISIVKDRQITEVHPSELKRIRQWYYEKWYFGDYAGKLWIYQL